MLTVPGSIPPPSIVCNNGDHPGTLPDVARTVLAVDGFITDGTADRHIGKHLSAAVGAEMKHIDFFLPRARCTGMSQPVIDRTEDFRIREHLGTDDKFGFMEKIVPAGRIYDQGRIVAFDPDAVPEFPGGRRRAGLPENILVGGSAEQDIGPWASPGQGQETVIGHSVLYGADDHIVR